MSEPARKEEGWRAWGHAEEPGVAWPGAARGKLLRLQHSGSSCWCPELGGQEGSGTCMPPHATQACPKGTTTVRIRTKSQPAWRQLESWLHSTPCRSWQKSLWPQVNLTITCQCEWFWGSCNRNKRPRAAPWVVGGHGGVPELVLCEAQLCVFSLWPITWRRHGGAGDLVPMHRSGHFALGEGSRCLCPQPPVWVCCAGHWAGLSFSECRGQPQHAWSVYSLFYDLFTVLSCARTSRKEWK